MKFYTMDIISFMYVCFVTYVIQYSLFSFTTFIASVYLTIILILSINESVISVGANKLSI